MRPLKRDKSNAVSFFSSPAVYIVSILIVSLIFAPYTAYADGRFTSAGAARGEALNQELLSMETRANILEADAREMIQACNEEYFWAYIQSLRNLAAEARAVREGYMRQKDSMERRAREIADELNRLIQDNNFADGATLVAKAGAAVAIGFAFAGPLGATGGVVFGIGSALVGVIDEIATREVRGQQQRDILSRLRRQADEIRVAEELVKEWGDFSEGIERTISELIAAWNARKPFCDQQEREARERYERRPDPSDWQEVAKGDLIDDSTGQALEGGSIMVDPVDDDTMTSPEDRVLQPGDRIIITAPCHEKRVYVVGVDAVPDKIRLKHKPLKIVMDCSLGDREIKRRAIDHFKEQGIDAKDENLDIKNIGKFDGVDKCEVTIKDYALANNQSCSGIPPTDASGAPDDSAGPGDESGTPGDGSGGPGDGIEVPRVREGQGVSDPLYNSRGSWGQPYDDQWALKAIGFAEDKDGKNLWPDVAAPVTVALIDTGIDMFHPDMLGAIWVNTDEIPANGKDDDGNGFIDDVNGWNFVDDNADVSDNNGHGTFVAGVIAAWGDNGVGIAGVNPWARIMPLKATDFNNKGESFNIAKAIRYATDNGARVINISIGGEGYSALEEAAVKDAVKKGVVVVVAAGNKGINTNEFFPAGLPEVITVASTDMNGKRVGFSNWGGQVDIAAPGVDVLSVKAKGTDFIMFEKKDYKKGLAIVGTDKLYYRTSGSSFSAPFVSGVASLILSINPDLTGEQVKRMVLYSADDIEVPGRDQYTGHGLLNARAALVADPDFYLDAAVKAVKAAKTKQGTMIQVVGTVDADKLKSAWVEIGAGDEPTTWEAVTKPIKKPVTDGVVGEFPSSALQGSNKWVIKVVAEHKDGRKTEARYNLTLK